MVSSFNSQPSDFYPRSPHGERPLLNSIDTYVPSNISIHALRMESDFARNRVDSVIYKFLSTLSAWRATYYLVSYGAGCRISIHALRMESDMQWAIETLGLNDISIHALRMESDIDQINARLMRGISIHALRMESDVGDYICPLYCPTHFYPRSPHGERQIFKNL